MLFHTSFALLILIRFTHPGDVVITKNPRQRGVAVTSKKYPSILVPI